MLNILNNLIFNNVISLKKMKEEPLLMSRDLENQKHWEKKQLYNEDQHAGKKNYVAMHISIP